MGPTRHFRVLALPWRRSLATEHVTRTPEKHRRTSGPRWDQKGSVLTMKGKEREAGRKRTTKTRAETEDVEERPGLFAGVAGILPPQAIVSEKGGTALSPLQARFSTTAGSLPQCLSRLLTSLRAVPPMLPAPVLHPRHRLPGLLAGSPDACYLALAMLQGRRAVVAVILEALGASRAFHFPLCRASLQSVFLRVFTSQGLKLSYAGWGPSGGLNSRWMGQVRASSSEL
ncbi:hypothetical protein NDU88_005780 [Pleurodeles waltl]|uniref:Uncharacterized protein n=1 Tax=Pleurodeles waltl TaxID=8319 RepID=A0AAV7TC30_PLEWA|nr:hypothetical protein NDU88_005780 [Pleurodeles waltl]